MSGSQLVDRWQKLHGELDKQDVTLLAVSKYNSDEEITELAAAGHVDFAESRPQALRDRAQKFPNLHWHMIGPVQKNKAKYVGQYASVWHSLCDITVAEKVAESVVGRQLPVLLQVNISGERQKFGIPPNEVSVLLEKVKAVPNLKVIGLMGMAAKNDGSDDENVRRNFRALRSLRDELADESLSELCMGMSGDFRIAVEEGATMVRLGTVLFGTRSINP